MPKENKTFVMPGAEPDDYDNAEPLTNLSFTEPTEEELAAAAAAEERKKQREEEEAADAAAAEAKKAEEEKAAEEDKKSADKDLTDEEKAEAAKIEAERAAKEDKGKKQPMVPKSRLDEVLAKNKELTAKLEAEQKARESRQPEKKEGEQPFDFDAKEEAYMQAVIDGEKEKALAIRKEIRAAEKAAMQQTAAAEQGQNSEAVALAAAAAVIEENFPQFVKGSEKYNEEATMRVVKMRDALIAQGSNAVEALNEAVDFVVKKYGFDEDLEPETKTDTKVVNLDEKRKKDVEKKVDAHKRQPPEIKGEGERTRQKEEHNAVAEMSDEEFNALPEATKRRMRGDFL